MSDTEQAELAEEIYQEKYAQVATVSMSADEVGGEDFVDIAYRNMMERETYIVELISLHSGSETTTVEWEYNLNYLQCHYDEIMSMEDVVSMYVDLYIEDYEIVLATKDMPAAQINGVRTRASSYSSSDAVAYAKEYYYPYNSAYPDWSSYGGDCANFISQCLYAGGKSMKGTPGTSAAAQDWSNWFSTGSSCNTSNVSSTWRGANAFKSYWQSNASGYSTFSSVGDDSYSYGYTGDVVSLLNSNGSAYHTLIIVGYDWANRDFIVAAHTYDTVTAHLSDYSPSGGFIIYNMR
ncbi:MAG: amidase domain-containing protein [Clostridium sp.]|nr:amidase domain-containing protein [Clostridium sp.]MCM1561496.1 amidase domain-containing protein [Butyrivibrio sp.]